MSRSRVSARGVPFNRELHRHYQTGATVDSRKLITVAFEMLG